VFSVVRRDKFLAAASQRFKPRKRQQGGELLPQKNTKEHKGKNGEFEPQMKINADGESLAGTIFAGFVEINGWQRSTKSA
jgi:hypothetical protein